jgi:hypothetical protein
MKILDGDKVEKDLYGESLRSALMSGLKPIDAAHNTQKQWAVKDENGDIWDYDSLDNAVNAAKEIGGKLWMPEDDMRANTSALGTFAKEAASSATLGLYDYYLRDEETAKVEREEHPIASGMGQVAGFVAPMLVSGGLSVAAKGAQAFNMAKTASTLSKGAQATSLDTTLGKVLNPEGWIGAGAGNALIAKAGTLKGNFATNKAITKVADILAKPITVGATVGLTEGVVGGARQIAKEVISPLDDVDMTHTMTTLGAGLIGGAILGGIGSGLTGKGGLFNPERLRSDVLAPTTTSKVAASKVGEKVSKSALYGEGVEEVAEDVIARNAKFLNEHNLLKSNPEETINAINKFNHANYKQLDESFKIINNLPKFNPIQKLVGGLKAEPDKINPYITSKPSATWSNIRSTLDKKLDELEKVSSITKTQQKAVAADLDEIQNKIFAISETFEKGNLSEGLKDLLELNKGLGARIGDFAFKQTNGKPVSRFYKEKIYVSLRDLRNEIAAVSKANKPLNEEINRINNLFEQSQEAASIARKALRPDQKGIIEQLGGLTGISIGVGGSFVNPFLAVPAYLAKLAYQQPGVKLKLANEMEGTIVDLIKSTAIPGGTSIGRQVVNSLENRRKEITFTPGEYSDHLGVLNSITTDGPTAEYMAYANKLDALKPGMGAKLAGQLTTTGAFLQSKAPQMKVQPGLDGRVTMPTKTQMDSYGRYLVAATQPQTILETLKMGRKLSAEEKEVLNVLYPEMLTLINEALMEQVANKQIINKTAYKSITGQGTDLWSDPKNAGYLQETWAKQAEAEKQSSKGIQSSQSDRVRNKQGLGS